MNKENIEANKQLNIRDFYEEREILKEALQCPACENYSFHVLKIYDEQNEDSEFIIKGLCLVCGLNLTEEDMKALKIL